MVFKIKGKTVLAMYAALNWGRSRSYEMKKSKSYKGFYSGSELMSRSRTTDFSLSLSQNWFYSFRK